MSEPVPVAGKLRQHGQELRRKIEQIANRGKTEQLLEAFGEVRVRLQGHQQRAARLLGNLRVMRDAGGMLQTSDLTATRHAQSLSEKIDKLQTRLKETPDNLKGGRENVWGKFDAEADEMAKTLERDLRAAWDRFVVGQARDTASLQPFRHAAGWKPVLDALDSLARQLHDHRGKLPENDAGPAAVRALGQRMDDEISKLPAPGDIPPAVLEFIKQAAQGGVSLASLTDEVLACLRERDLTLGLSVVSGMSVGRGPGR